MYDEYLYINGKYELIGNTGNMSVDIDLSQYIKKEDAPPVFYWDGLSSDDNPENIALWQKIYDESKEQTVMIFASNQTDSSIAYKGIFIINNQSIPSNNRATTIKGTCSSITQSITGETNAGAYLVFCLPTINITVNIDKKVTKVTKINYTTVISNKYLPADSTTIKNYTPTYDYHPATKKYVDDNVPNFSKYIWNGPDNSSEDANIELAKNIFNDVKAGKTIFIYIISDSDYHDSEYQINNIIRIDNSNYIEMIDNNNNPYETIVVTGIESSINISSSKTNTISQLSFSKNDYYFEHYISTDEYDVFTIPVTINGFSYLDIQSNSDSYYIPSYNSNPTSKGYVDREVRKSLATNNIYSAQKVKIGTTEDNKPIYREKIDLGTIGKNGTISHPISNLEYILDLKGGFKFDTDKSFVPWGFYNKDVNTGTGIYYNGTAFAYNSGFNGTNGFVIVEYVATN